MPIQQMIEVELKDLNNGQFVEDLAEELSAAHARLARYARAHGDRAVGAKSVVTAKITLAVDAPNQFSVKAETASKHPSRPPFVAGLMMGLNDDGEPVLTMSAYGDADPHQGRLCTNEGDLVDQDTGEVIPMADRKRTVG